MIDESSPHDEVVQLVIVSSVVVTKGRPVEIVQQRELIINLVVVV